ncbi:MAG TPA: hypothetical protein VN154_12385, partial [Rhizomicrobium sp.]|nr:hypothetical protein [Rhizomicrobium sp.]
MSYRWAFSVLALCIVLAVYFGLGAGADKKHLYPMQVSEVNQLLDQIALPELIFADHAFGAKHWRENDNVSIWALQSSDGAETLRLTATTSAASAGTQVAVEVLPPVSKNGEKVKNMLDENPAFRDLCGSALAEQIDAKLRNRPFSIANVSRAMTRVMLHAAPQI